MGKAFYQKKKYNKKYMKVLAIVLMKPIAVHNAIIDKKICGMSLKRVIASKYRESHGATSATATSYAVLSEVIDTKKINENSKFIDVGCGKGRVLAYLLNKKVNCKMVGVELDADVAEIAKSWTEKYKNVEIIQDNVFDLDISEYTDFCLSRPFERDAFIKFLNKIESEAKQQINVYLISDQQIGDYLDNREGWTLEERGILYFKKGLFVYFSPQRYSVLSFNPKK